MEPKDAKPRQALISSNFNYMTDNPAGQSEHTHGSGSHGKHLNQPVLDSVADLAEESKPCLYSFFCRIKL